MSDTSSDESEDINVTGLVATRARRGNAGNLYDQLRLHLDDADLQKELLAEDELDDAEDYEATEDEDEVLDSSSEDEEQDEVDGEKELQKAERAENKKRKATKLVWHRDVKRVRLERPRSDPQRQSIRASAIANREVVQANLQESAVRAQKQKATLQQTTRERANKRVDLTLEQRLEKCKRIEKETAKELGRFEREEAERQRIREEALMAKRMRVFDGPVIKMLTTSGIYEDGKLKVKRLLHGSQNDEQIEVSAEERIEEQHEEQIERQIEQRIEERIEERVEERVEERIEERIEERVEERVEERGGQHGEQRVEERGEQQGGQQDEQQGEQQGGQQDEQQGEQQVEQQDEQQGEQQVEQQVEQQIEQRSQDRIDNRMDDLKKLTPDTAKNTESTEQLHVKIEIKPEIDTIQHEKPERIQAQRSLLILEAFEDLDVRRKHAAWEPTAIAQILLPDSYPVFNDEQAAYLKKRKQKQEVKKCALTNWEGKYRDPKTGVVFSDVPGFKMLQRLIAGGCAWNSMLECWVGPTYGSLGRPAKGVPVGFDKT